MKDFLSNKKTKGILETIETTVIALAIFAVIYLTIAVPNKVEGQSMEPNFHQSDLLITNKTIQYLGTTCFGEKYDYNYKRGDVVIVKQGRTDLIKRIVAVEGEKVEIKNNGVYINGEKLNEKYLQTTTRTKLPLSELSIVREGRTITVPENSFFVMGDNRENSKDSRFNEVGFISRDELKGKVVLRYWPLSKIGLIHRGEYD